MQPRILFMLALYLSDKFLFITVLFHLFRVIHCLDHGQIQQREIPSLRRRADTFQSRKQQQPPLQSHFESLHPELEE